MKTKSMVKKNKGCFVSIRVTKKMKAAIKKTRLDVSLVCRDTIERCLADIMEGWED